MAGLGICFRDSLVALRRPSLSQLAKLFDLRNLLYCTDKGALNQKKLSQILGALKSWGCSDHNDYDHGIGLHQAGNAKKAFQQKMYRQSCVEFLLWHHHQRWVSWLTFIQTVEDSGEAYLLLMLVSLEIAASSSSVWTTKMCISLIQHGEKCVNEIVASIPPWDPLTANCSTEITLFIHWLRKGHEEFDWSVFQNLCCRYHSEGPPSLCSTCSGSVLCTKHEFGTGGLNVQVLCSGIPLFVVWSRG